MMEDLIERVVDALVNEKSVASSTRIVAPFILKTTKPADQRQVVNIPQNLSLKKETRAAISAYKADSYGDINELLDKYQGRLDVVSDTYGTGSSYEMVTDLVASLHDGLLATQQFRDTNKEVRFTPFAQQALERFFETFPWKPLELHSDKVVRTSMANRAITVGKLIMDDAYELSYSNLPPTVIRNTKQLFRSKWYTTLADRFRSLRKHLRYRTATDMSYDLTEAIATCNISRDMVVYRGGHRGEFAIPSTSAQAQASVGKIVTGTKFLSTSSSLEKAAWFLQENSDTLYVITVPKGLHALPVEAICAQLKIQIYMNEMEFLFAPGHKIRIDRIEYAKDPKRRVEQLRRRQSQGLPLDLRPSWGELSNQFLDYYFYDLNKAQYVVYGTLIDDGVTA